MTGCPQWLRPGLFLPRSGSSDERLGTYHLYLGAAFDGSRLNKLYRQDVNHEEIIQALTPLLEAYAKEREKGERFGNFVVRKGIVAPSTNGAGFHENVMLEAAE